MRSIASALLRLVYAAFGLDSEDDPLADPNSDHGWTIDPDG